MYITVYIIYTYICTCICMYFVCMYFVYYHTHYYCILCMYCVMKLNSVYSIPAIRKWVRKERENLTHEMNRKTHTLTQTCNHSTCVHCSINIKDFVSLPLKVIGWRDPSLRMLLYMSNAGFHLAGDGKVSYSTYTYSSSQSVEELGVHWSTLEYSLAKIREFRSWKWGVGGDTFCMYTSEKWLDPLVVYVTYFIVHQLVDKMWKGCNCGIICMYVYILYVLNTTGWSSVRPKSWCVSIRECH